MRSLSRIALSPLGCTLRLARVVLPRLAATDPDPMSVKVRQRDALQLAAHVLYVAGVGGSHAGAVRQYQLLNTQPLDEQLRVLARLVSLLGDTIGASAFDLETRALEH